MNKLMMFCAVIFIVLAVAFTVVTIIMVRKDKKTSRCCGYCTYWFKCNSRLGGRCDKHSTAKAPFYTKWDESCGYYDGFAGED